MTIKRILLIKPQEKNKNVRLSWMNCVKKNQKSLGMNRESVSSKNSHKVIVPMNEWKSLTRFPYGRVLLESQSSLGV